MNRTLNRKNRLDGSFNLQDRNSLGATLFGFRDPGDGRGINTSVGWTHNFTTRTINSLRYSFSRNRTHTVPFFAYGDNVAADLGIQGVSNNPINYGPPNLSFTNYGALNDASAVLVRNQTSGVTESVSFGKGAHNLTAGVRSPAHAVEHHHRQRCARHILFQRRGYQRAGGERAGGAEHRLRLCRFPAGPAAIEFGAFRRYQHLFPIHACITLSPWTTGA